MSPTKNISEKFLTFRKFSEKNKPLLLKVIKRIRFENVALDSETGALKNVHLLYRMLPVMETYTDIFDEDTLSPDRDYGQWLDVVIEFIKDVEPWFYIVMVDKQPKGVFWANNWESFGAGYHSVEIGGLCSRKVNPLISLVSFYRFLSMVFDNTEIYIARAEFDSKNKAVKNILNKVGFRNPEPRRAYRIKGGTESMGTIMSITRPEWEALHEPEKEEE